MRYKGFVFILVLFVFSCSTLGSGSLSSRSQNFKQGVFLDVPFYPQTEYACGPASLAGVYNYWGHRITIDEIVSAFKIKAHKGVLTLDLLIHAKKQGFKVKTVTGSIDELKRLIDKRIPVIVLLDIGFSILQKNHFVTVVGYNPEGFFIHDGEKKGRFIAYKDFSRSWKRAGKWMLVITP